MTKTETIKRLRKAGFKVVSNETTPGAYKTWFVHRTCMEPISVASAAVRAFPRGTFDATGENRATREWEMTGDHIRIETQCLPEWDGEPGQIFVANLRTDASVRRMNEGLDY